MRGYSNVREHLQQGSARLAVARPTWASGNTAAATQIYNLRCICKAAITGTTDLGS